VQEHLAANDREYEQLAHSTSLLLDQGPIDYLFLNAEESINTQICFERLRWGGQVVVMADEPDHLGPAAQALAMRPEFQIEHRQLYIWSDSSDRAYDTHDAYLLTARKMSLVEHERFSKRFTYQVELVPDEDTAQGFAVRKTLPPDWMLRQRLAEKFPTLSGTEVQKRAAFLMDEVFPVFLTREVGMLILLAERLPEIYKSRVPRVLSVHRNRRGRVIDFKMTWVRNNSGGKPISTMDFAKQSADLLRQIHGRVGMIHQDLRLDNIAVTADGVGFLDFGLSVRLNESIENNPPLKRLFDQFMRTSEVQKHLHLLCEKGVVTSEPLRACRGKIDRLSDLFFIVLQMTRPLANPDFHNLVQDERNTPGTNAIRRLAKEVFSPTDPTQPQIMTANHVYQSLKLAKAKLDQSSDGAQVSTA
jgi:hypothetical protein